MRGRGQATVELLLGTLLFVTVLTVGLHFGEVLQQMLQTQEAGANALWDVSGRRLHDYAASDNVQVRDTSIAVGSARTAFRYRDWVGFGPDRGLGARLPFSDAAGLQVTCEPNASVADWSDVESTALFGNQPIFGGGLKVNSGVTCSAEGVIQPARLPEHFLERDRRGFFDVQNFAGPLSLKTCALGLARDGECRQRYAMLIDDWGLNGLRDESRPCLMQEGPRCENAGYYRLVHRVYERLMNDSSAWPEPRFEIVSALAENVTHRPSPMPDPEHFWFSYSNQSSGWTDPGYPTNDEANERWNTGTGFNSRAPEYRDSYSMRGDSWLGMPKGWKPR